MQATRPYIPRIAVVFDFDKTLASDMMDVLVSTIGLEREEWERRYVKPLIQNGDEILLRGWALIRAARDMGRPVTPELIREAAARVEPFPGVLDMPERLRRLARETHPPIECEFVVLTCGFEEVVRATPIANVFDRIWAGAFLYEDGEAVAMKRVITHPEKARYLEAFAKGLGLHGADEPLTAAKGLDEVDHHVLLDQMIYVGDGASDLLAFGFIEQSGGVAIAVRHDGAFAAAEAQLPGQRVSALVDPDFSEGSALLTSLELAVRAAAARIALRSLPSSC